MRRLVDLPEETWKGLKLEALKRGITLKALFEVMAAKELEPEPPQVAQVERIVTKPLAQPLTPSAVPNATTDFWGPRLGRTEPPVVFRPAPKTSVRKSPSKK